MNDLYDMKLHEEVSTNDQNRIVRVPGGWIYYFDNEQIGGHWQTTSTFVPFHSEFIASGR